MNVKLIKTGNLSSLAIVNNGQVIKSDIVTNVKSLEYLHNYYTSLIESSQWDYIEAEKSGESISSYAKDVLGLD